MKKRHILLVVALFVSLLVLTGCVGSSTYQGSWKAQDGSGSNTTITFTKNKMTIVGSTASYTQDATGFKNNVSYVGIRVDGADYTLVFPDKDKSIALLVRPSATNPSTTDDYLKGTMLYAMNKKMTPNYQNYSSKYRN